MRNPFTSPPHKLPFRTRKQTRTKTTQKHSIQFNRFRLNLIKVPYSSAKRAWLLCFRPCSKLLWLSNFTKAQIFPKVTFVFCRLPWPAFFCIAKASYARPPVAVICTVWNQVHLQLLHFSRNLNGEQWRMLLTCLAAYSGIQSISRNDFIK